MSWYRRAYVIKNISCLAAHNFIQYFVLIKRILHRNVRSFVLSCMPCANLWYWGCRKMFITNMCNPLIVVHEKFEFLNELNSCTFYVGYHNGATTAYVTSQWGTHSGALHNHKAGMLLPPRSSSLRYLSCNWVTPAEHGSLSNNTTPYFFAIAIRYDRRHGTI